MFIAFHLSNLKGKTYKFLLLCVRFQGNFEVFTKWKRNKFTGHIIIFQEANYTVPYSGLKIEESIAHPLVKIHDFISSQLNPSLPSKDKRTCSIHTCTCIIAKQFFSLLADIAQEFLQEFTLAYNTAYGVEYTKLTLKEIDAESFAEEKPAYQLMQRSVSFLYFLWSLQTLL